MHSRNQKPHHGKHRKPLTGYMEKAIRQAIKREAERYNVSRSFVVAVACAYALGVDLGEQTYKPVRTPPRLRLVR